MILSRRSILGGLAGLVAAPAIVRVNHLMPIKPLTELMASTVPAFNPDRYLRVALQFDDGRVTEWTKRNFRISERGLSVDSTSFVADAAGRVSKMLIANAWDDRPVVYQDLNLKVAAGDTVLIKKGLIAL